MITLCCASACTAYSILAADAETNKTEQIKKFDWQKNAANLKKVASHIQEDERGSKKSSE